MFLTGNFPYIEHLDQLREKVGHHPEVRFNTHDNGFTTVCYMIGNAELWSGEDAGWVQECRGITFAPDGKVASRPLHKFFNVNERPETQHGSIDWTLLSRRSDKRDGSMITPVLVDGKVCLKSKKSFTSDVAWAAQRYVDMRQRYKNFCRELLTNGMTPIFEYTSPKARIVINYKSETLTLLHVRNNITGNYMDDITLHNLATQWQIPVVDAYPAGNMEYFFNEVEHGENFEGYVFQFKNGDMVKLKSKWYLNLHHNVVFLSERRVAEMVLEETLDDFKSFLVGGGSFDSLKRVEEIETIISHDLAILEIEVEALVNARKEVSKKDFAIELCKHPLFGLAITLFDDRDPKYKEHYTKWILKEKFGLDQV